MLIGAGCVNEQCEGYKLLTVNKDIARFSLEYPCNWRRTRVETYTDHDKTSLSLCITGPGIKIDGSRSPSTLWGLDIIWISEGSPNATTVLENSLSIWASTSSSFQLLERSTVEIAGIQAEQAIFHNTIDADRVLVKKPATIICKQYFFEYDGLIWIIYSSSVLAIAEENEVLFNHIIQTFRILD